MISSPRLSILSNAGAADLKLEPYPHLIVRNALDADVFEQLQRELPSDELVVDRRPVADTWYDYPACRVIGDQRISQLWQEFFAYHVSREFFLELLRVCGPAPSAARRPCHPHPRFR